jgi:phosphopentomutase
MKTQAVCAFHGGKAPRALANAQRAAEAADLRIRGLTPDAVEVLKELLHATSESVVLGAVKDILDRGGLKASHRIQLGSEITVVRPW